MHRRKEIGSTEFIVLVACIMLLTALAIDIMLPAFDELRDYFGLGQDSTATAQIVTFFFLGQIGQVVFGPLSDRFGRIGIMRMGFALYVSGCIAAALSSSLNGILAARFVVGLGSAALSVCATATVRDRFEGDKMARIMSLILTIFLMVPIAAPLLGSAILSVASWQAVFIAPALFAVIVFVWSLRLNESLPPERRNTLALSSIFKSVQSIAGNRVFLRYTAITTILFSAFSSYIGSSERMISEIYGQPELFIWIFGGVGLVMAIFTFLNAQLVGRFGAWRAVRGFLLAYFILACVLLAITLVTEGKPNIFIFFALIALLQGINVGAEPNSSALALEPLGSVAGMAAAIYGTSFLVVGAVMGSFIDRMLIDSVAPLAVAYFIAGLAAVILTYSERTKPVSETPSSVAFSKAGD